MSVIFEDVAYIYNKGTPMEKKAIKGVSLSISDGEFVVFSGKAGCGKSTLLQLMGGILRPTSGSITITPHPDPLPEGARESPVGGGVGVVFQFPERQFFENTVYADLSFPLRRAGVSEEEIANSLMSALRAVDMDFDAYRDRSPMELSSGEKRRAAIASVLVLDPQVIAMDEPLAGLDQKGKREIIQELKRLQKEAGKTVVMATQEMEAVSGVFDRVFSLENGSLAATENPSLLPISSLVNILKKKGLDLGEGVMDAEEAFLRIRSMVKKAGEM